MARASERVCVRTRRRSSTPTVGWRTLPLDGVDIGNDQSPVIRRGATAPAGGGLPSGIHLHAAAFVASVGCGVSDPILEPCSGW